MFKRNKLSRIRPWAGHLSSAHPDRLCCTLRLSSRGYWLLFSVGAWSWPFDLYLLQRLLSTSLFSWDCLPINFGLSRC